MVFEHINSHTVTTKKPQGCLGQDTICGKKRLTLRFWVQLALQIAYLKLYFGLLPSTEKIHVYDAVGEVEQQIDVTIDP